LPDVFWLVQLELERTNPTPASSTSVSPAAKLLAPVVSTIDKELTFPKAIMLERLDYDLLEAAALISSRENWQRKEKRVS
jgi:hypothetical protein